MAGLAVKATATVLMFRYAVVLDHAGLQILFALLGCGGILMTAMTCLGLWVRLRDGDIANPS